MPEHDWMKWPIGLIGYVPPNDPITEELLKEKINQALQVGAEVIAFPCEVEGYALWQTEILPMASNAEVDDVLETTIRLAGANDLKVIGHWMGVHCQSCFWDRHSEWLQRNYEGELISAMPGGLPWPALCLNSPFRENLKAQVSEVLGKYRLDGIYFDGLYQRFSGCYCKYCQSRYHKWNGGDMPEDSLDPRMVRFREDTVSIFMAELHKVIKQISPATPIILDTVGPTLGWLRGEDIPRLSPYVDVWLLESYWEVRRQLSWTDGMENRITRALSGLQVWAPKWLARSPDHEHVATPEATVKHWMGQSLTHASPPFALEQNLFQVDPSGMQVLSEVNRHCKALRSYLLDAASIAHVALFYSHETMHHLTPHMHEEVLEHFQGAYQALLENHIPFEVVTEEQALAGELQNYNVCILPNTRCMSDRIIHAIHSYVDDGGNLLCTYQTAIEDQNGKVRDQPVFKDLTGIEVSDVFRAEGPRGIARFGGQNPALYCRVQEGHVISQGLEGRLLSFSGNSFLVQPTEKVDVPAVVLNYDPDILAKDGFFTWYPGEELSPLITTRTLDTHSRIVYIAADLTRAFWLYGWPELARLFIQSVQWASQSAPPFEITSNHPLVEVRGYKGPADGCIILILSNLATNQSITVRGGGFPRDRSNLIRNHYATTVVPQHNLVIRMRSDLCGGKSLQALLSSDVSIKQEEEWINVELPYLGAYEAIIFE